MTLMLAVLKQMVTDYLGKRISTVATSLVVDLVLKLTQARNAALDLFDGEHMTDFYCAACRPGVFPGVDYYQK